jgi:Alr-MurF fusion protein
MYTIQQIQQLIKGQWLQQAEPGAQIAHLLLDSRQVLFAKSALFFAIPGEHHDGHDYLAQAYQDGVRNFVVSRKIGTHHNSQEEAWPKPTPDPKARAEQLSIFPDANIILVEDSLLALQQLAAFHRQQFDLLGIAITGSNGKTIVKELLFQLLRHRFKIVRSPKSYNSQVGVPLSVWQIEAEHELGIFEAGISQVGEMEKLAPIIDARVGLFTNIGPAHAEGFSSVEEKLAEKLALFKNCKSIVYCRDNKVVDKAIQKLVAASNKVSFTWSKTTAADLQIQSIQSKEAHTLIVALYKGVEISLQVPFLDEVYIENAIHCWAMALHLGLSAAYCYEHAKHLEPVEMRLQLKDGINDCSVINDSYNADLGALQIALQFLARQQQQKKRTLILSDILQSGQAEDKLYEEVARLLREQKINRFIGIGDSIPAIAAFLPKGMTSEFYNNTATFLAKFDPALFRQEIILLKGARHFEFEKIANRLSQKVHRTVLEINLNAISHNLHVYSRFLEAGTKMMVMVKASAYGSGSVEVARLLAFNKVDYLSVAYADEGISLRKAGIDLPIMVLNPEEGSLEETLRYGLEPEVYSLGLLKALVALVITKRNFHQKENHPDQSFEQTPIHLKLDTGMNRLGFREEDLTEVITILQQQPQLKVQSVFSHLAASEAEEHDAFTLSQIERFDQMYSLLTEALGYRPMRHILNSGGIIRFPERHMEMVRLGIGLYGLDSSQQIQDQLQVVLTLKASISQIKTVKAGETIGYSRKGVAIKDMRIATISIGYADGLLRAAGNGKHQVNIRGQLAPIIGNVCMDMCMVDVSHVAEAREGDEVVIFGERPTVTDLAKAMGTIGYEVFTGVSGRVRRVYLEA